MPNSSNFSFASAWPGIAAVMGVLLVALGLGLPALADPTAGISQDQTTEYLEAHAALEKAAAEQGRRKRSGEIPENPDQANTLQAARQRFEKAKEEVESAKSNSKSLATYCRIGGILLVVVGAGGLIAQKSG